LEEAHERMSQIKQSIAQDEIDAKTEKERKREEDERQKREREERHEKQRRETKKRMEKIREQQKKEDEEMAKRYKQSRKEFRSIWSRINNTDYLDNMLAPRFHEGDVVEGFYSKDGKWYGATVGPESRPNQVHLLWDDGAKGFVVVQNVRLKSTETMVSEKTVTEKVLYFPDLPQNTSLSKKEDDKSGLSDDDIDRRLLNLVAPDEMFPAVPTPILDNLKTQKEAEEKKLVTVKAKIQSLVLQRNTMEANIKRLDGQILSEAGKCNQIDADEWLNPVNPKCPQCGVRRNDFFDEAKEEAMLPEGQTFKDLEEKCPRCKQPWAWVEELPDTPKSQSPTELSTAELELMISKM